jgi:hypothetical protein
MKAGEGDRRTVIGDGEVGGFEIEDWLLFPGADDQVEGDFIGMGAGGRLRGRLVRGSG